MSGRLWDGWTAHLGGDLKGYRYKGRKRHRDGGQQVGGNVGVDAKGGDRGRSLDRMGAQISCQILKISISHVLVA